MFSSCMFDEDEVIAAETEEDEIELEEESSGRPPKRPTAALYVES